MWQQQGPFMSSNSSNIPLNGNYMYTEINNPPMAQYYSLENQGQYATYPGNVIYRHASGPGWQ